MTYSLEISTACLRGTSRERNEDAVCVNGTFLDQGDVSEYEFQIDTSPKGTIIMLADGMGGHPRGNWASKTALETVFALWERSAPGLDIEHAINVADKTLKDAVSGPPNPGTTLSGILINGKVCTSFNVGDSPILLSRKGHIQILSVKDRPPGSATNILSQCIGGLADDVPSAHTAQTTLEIGDAFILLTDGVGDYTSDADLNELLKNDGRGFASEICQLARENGSDDDTSAIIISVAVA